VMKVVVLDRDGVINEDSADYIKSEAEWQPLPGSIEAIAYLSKAGFQIAVATNQSGLGRGLFDDYALARMHQKLCTLVEEQGGQLDGIFYCPHLPDAGCECRKPSIGLLQQIEAEFSCNLEGQFFVGDSMKDLQAARSFSCKPLLVRTGNGAATETILGDEFSDSDLVPVFDDLASAAKYIVSVC
jgi:D-glycero-D-manno-heptose 1,7-bisphosphate phosphatase